MKTNTQTIPGMTKISVSSIEHNVDRIHKNLLPVLHTTQMNLLGVNNTSKFPTSPVGCRL